MKALSTLPQCQWIGLKVRVRKPRGIYQESYDAVVISFHKEFARVKPITDKPNAQPKHINSNRLEVIEAGQ